MRRSNVLSNLKRQVALLEHTVGLVEEAWRFKGCTTYTPRDDAYDTRQNDNVLSLSHVEIDAAACPGEATDNLVRHVQILELAVGGVAKSFTGQRIEEGDDLELLRGWPAS